MRSPYNHSAGALPEMRRYLLTLAVLMLVGMACSISIPAIDGSKTPTGAPAPAVATATGIPVGPGPTGAPADSAQPTPLPDLPPALVEVDPLPESELTPKTTPVFYFNQPMERASVEAAFQFQPGQPGSFEWLDDATVRFVPSADVDTHAGLEVTINAGARAANGKEMAQPVAVRYQAAGPLLTAERLPLPDANEVNPSSAVVVTFNRPVVALGAVEGLPPAFTLDPASPGRGEWLNTSTYIFYPDPALAGGARYTVRLNSALTSTEGIPLDPSAGLEWSFSTAAPRLLSITPTTERPILLDSTLVLAFNQPMEGASVEAGFSLSRQDGSAVEGTFTWNDAGNELTFKPDALLDRAATYSLVLSGSAKSLGGAPIGENFAAVLTTVPQFSVISTRPGAGETLEAYGGFGSIGLAFSSPVAAGQDLTSLMTVSPEIIGLDASRSFDGSQVFISGYFEPATSYTVTVASGLRDRWEASLGTPYSFTFSTKAPPPSLVIPARMMGVQSIYIPGNEVSLPVNAANIDRLDIKRGRMTLEQFLQADPDYEGLKNWQPLVDEEWTVPLDLREDIEEEIDIPLTPDWTPLDAGLYFLKIDPQPGLGQGGDIPPLLLVVSPVQMTLKTSARQAFVWAVGSADNRPLENARISFYDGETYTVLGTCITDPDGKCQAELPLRGETYKPIYAVLGQPGEADFSIAASNWNQGISPWDFSVRYWNEGGQPEIYMYTERPIYRPGQAVNYRVVVRDKDNGRYGAAPWPGLTIDVSSPYDPVTGQTQVLATHNLAVDAYGAASGTYILPEDAAPGTYTLRVGEAKFQELTFEVAEYRKPEIDLQVAFDAEDVLAGGDLQAKVTAKYFFGAPAGNMPVRWTLTRSRAWLSLPDNLLAGPVDVSWMNPWGPSAVGEMYVIDGQAQIGADGTVNLVISGEDLLERLGDTAADQTQALRLEVTVEDESGLPVSARASTRLHPSESYIGVRAESWNGQAGEEMTYTVRTLDWSDAPLGEKTLNARFSKVTWKKEETGALAYPAWTMETAEIGSTDFRTSPDGDARLAFTPQNPGSYMLEVTGEDGALTQILTWVSGPGAVTWPELPNQRLKLNSDRSGPAGEPGEYKPGETARVFIPNPFADGALALITVERGKVMRSSVVPVEGASYELELPLTNEDAPNIFVSVVLLGRTESRPDFRMGIIELVVDPASLLLDVAVEISPEQPQPGGDVTITLRAKDVDGKPVQGAFSLALVDKAVLALKEPNSEPVTEAFYGIQPLGVQSSLSLVAYSGRFVYMPPGRGGGGGGDMVVPPPVRTKFEDTAYWNGAVVTDVTGIAQVTVTLPDNLTTWRADARGLTADALVGQAQTDIVVGKPLLISPVVPRFAVAGDHLEMAAVVHNNTEEARSASVRLESVGFTLDDLNQTAQPVELQPGERRRVSWWGTVQNVASLDLTFSVETVDGGTPLRDAARPENNPLPVLRYSAPQTFGTSGMLSEAGERLELTSLPRTFSPTGGELNLEISPSLTAGVLDGLKVLEEYPSDFTETVVSRLLPNLAMHEALREFQLEDEALLGSLETAITTSVERLSRAQNEDGGWGWADGYRSDPYISSCVLLGLSRASRQGAFVSPDALRKAQDYLLTTFAEPSPETEAWQLDRQAFRFFALQDSGRTDLNIGPLYEFREKLSPWGKAFLAMAIDGQNPGDERARTLLSDLQSSASRSSTGANWQDPSPASHNWSTPAFTTAVVAYAVARLDPASPVLADAVRYLMLNRNPRGAWSSSFDTSWALLALIETVRGTGGVQAGYRYSAALNGSPLIQGVLENPAQAVNPVSSSVPLANLRPSAPNALLIQRGEGEGRLFYRAFLRVDRPVEDAPSIQRGMSITRQYYLAGQDCRDEACTPLAEVDLTNPQPVQVRLTLTVPEDMYYVVVEDTIPSGTEVLNPRLKTSQQVVAPQEEQPPAEETPSPGLPYDPENPFSEGWGWWLFHDPQTFDDHVRWVVEYLPAGTYELTYRLTPYLAGEFRVLPARAWQHHFPEVQAASKGEILVIR